MGAIGKALRAVALDVSLLRRRRDLRLLTIGYAVSLAGGEFTVVALNVQLYALTHSTVAVGLLGLAEFVPIVALALIGGALADAFDRRKLIRGAEGAAMLVSGALGGGAGAGASARGRWAGGGGGGAVRWGGGVVATARAPPPPPGVLYTAAALSPAATAVRPPPLDALMPLTVERQELKAATA